MKRKPAGMALTVAGILLFGWGLYRVMGLGSCGGLRPPCPSNAWMFVMAVPAGFIVSFIGLFMGGGAFGFLGMFAAVGVASILRGFNGGIGGDGDQTFPFVFGGLFLLPVLLPLVLIPFRKRRVQRAERLVAEGRKGIATVTAVEDTGVTINNDPRVRLRFSIQPEDGGPAFEGSKAMVVPRVDIPRAGDRYPVWYDPQDPSEFGIGTEVEASAPADVRALFAKAAAPTPLAQPAPAAGQEWVSDLGRLNDLRLSGALTDEEFNRAKERLLAGSPPAPAGG